MGPPEAFFAVWTEHNATLPSKMNYVSQQSNEHRKHAKPAFSGASKRVVAKQYSKEQ